MLEKTHFKSKQGATAHALFKPVSWSRQFDFINQLVLNNNVLISVLGEPGSGKSSFARLLESNINTSITAERIAATHLFHEAEFLDEINERFHLDLEGELTLTRVVHDMNRRQLHCLIIIDDAHELPLALVDSFLEAIKEQGPSGYFHLCLVSNFTKVASLNNLAVGSYENLVHSMEIGVLAEEELRPYLLERLLPLKGAEVESLLTDSRIHEFYQLTAGCFVGINSQMSSFFHLAPKSSGFVQLPKKHPVIALGGFMVFVLGAAFFWQMKSQSPVLDEPLALIKTPSEDAMVVQALSTPPTVMTVSAAPLTSQIPAYYIDAVREPIESSPAQFAGDELALNEGVANEPVSEGDQVVSLPSIPANQPKAVKAQKKKAMNQNSVTSRQAAGKKAVAHGFVIQLYASRNRVDTEKFIATYRLKARAHVYKSLRDGATWYVVALGRYDERLQAKQALDHLPSQLVALKPWIRQRQNLSAFG